MRKTKKCSKCKNNKPLKDFSKNKNSKDGYHHYCKKCKNDDGRERYKTDVKYRERIRNSALKRKYNISYDEFLIKFNSQNGKCGICEKELFLDKQNTCVDHNHVTGEVRDVLCSRCNNLVGLSDENVNLLKKVILYIETYNE